MVRRTEREKMMGMMNELNEENVKLRGIMDSIVKGDIIVEEDLMPVVQGETNPSIVYEEDEEMPLTDKLELPLPIPLSSVGRQYFEDLIYKIDEMSASEAGLGDLKAYVDKELPALKKYVMDNMKAWMIPTKKAYKGSELTIESALTNIDGFIDQLRRDLDADVFAKDIKIDKAIQGSKLHVQSAIDAIDNELKQLRKDLGNIKPSTLKLSPSIAGADNVETALKNISSNADLALVVASKDPSASNVNTARSYQGSSKNVESALSSISAAIDSNAATIDLLQDIINNIDGEVGEVGDIGASLNRRINLLERESKRTKKASEIRVDDKNNYFKSTDVEGALEELFILADDVHSKWAASVGTPLSKSDTAEVKYDKTSKLLNEGRDNLKQYGVNISNSSLNNVVEGISEITIGGIQKYYKDNGRYKSYNRAPGREATLGLIGDFEVDGLILGWSYTRSIINPGSGASGSGSGNYKNPNVYGEVESDTPPSSVKWIGKNKMKWEYMPKMSDSESIHITLNYIGRIIKSPTLYSDDPFDGLPELPNN